MGRAVVRADTRHVMGVVGTSWRPVQNREAFAFLDGMVAEGEVQYHTAGALGAGNRVWLLAKLPGQIRVAGTDDVSEKYLLLANGHDGTLALRCLFTPVRVVCQNTLSLALRGQKAGAGVTLRHTGDVKSKLSEARRTLGLAEQFYTDLEAKANRLASVAMTSDRCRRYFEAVFPLPDEPEKHQWAVKSARETHDKLLGLFERGKGADLRGVRHTLWAAYNAVTEYVDHAKPSYQDKKKSLEENRSARLDRIWFGAGASLKASAFEHAMAFASAN
jgi:phage/plasmid-like protein (TIGR03299 family)